MSPADRAGDSGNDKTTSNGDGGDGSRSDATDVLPVDAPTDTPLGDAPADVRMDAPADVPMDTPADVPFDAPPNDAPLDLGFDAPLDAPSIDAPSDAAPDPFVSYRWVALPAPLGAPISAVTVDSEGTLYAGTNAASYSPGAGIFKSTDEGVSWKPVNRGIYDFHVASLAAVGTTVYAGTSGLLRSTDRGVTWRQVTPPASVGIVRYIGAQGDLVVAGSDYGGEPLYTSTNGGGIFTAGQFAALSVTSLEVLAGGTVILKASDSGVVRSTDKGVTFNNVQGIYNGLGFDAQLGCDGATTCYANAHNTATWTDPAVLMKSTDAGATWTPISPTRFQAGIVAVSDTGILYVETGTTQIARSDDGGASFSLIFKPTTTGSYQPSCGGPFRARGDKLFAACPDGVYRSADRGQHWQPASGSPGTGPITGYVYRMLVDTSPTSLGPTGDIYVVGAEGGVGTTKLKRSIDGGWTWQALASPFVSSGPCIVTPSGALECLDVTLSYPGSVPVVRSEDHGVTWRSITPPPGPAAGTSLPISALVTGASVIYAAAGNNGVWRSTDDGLTFQAIPNSPAVTILQVLRNGHLLAAPDTRTSGGFRSTDQGTTWQPIDGLYGLPGVEDANGRLIRNIGSVWLEVSTDEGVTWTIPSSSGVPWTGGDRLPVAIDGAGHLFVIGPGPAPGGPLSPAYGSPLQISASVDGGLRFTPMPDQIPNPNTVAFATDKQGRLIAATTGGVFRLLSDTDPGPPMPDGGVGDGGKPDGGGGGPPPRPLSVVVTGAPWALTGTSGVAADASQRVYASDDNNVWVVDGATVSPYLTLSETTSGAGLAYSSRFRDLDVGPDGLLYALLSGGLMGATTGTDLVVTSNGAHQTAFLASLGGFTDGHMEVVSAGRVAYLSTSGFFSATSAGTQSIYTAAALGSASNCAIQDSAIDGTGAVAFMPGCFGRAMQRGTVAGGPLDVLYQPHWDLTYGENVSCLAHDPAGGFYFLVMDAVAGGPRLVHVPANVTSTAPLPEVRTEPTFGEMRLARGISTGPYCKMAVAPNGTIYVMIQKEMWKVGP